MTEPRSDDLRPIDAAPSAIDGGEQEGEAVLSDSLIQLPHFESGNSDDNMFMFPNSGILGQDSLWLAGASTDKADGSSEADLLQQFESGSRGAKLIAVEVVHDSICADIEQKSILSAGLVERLIAAAEQQSYLPLETRLLAFKCACMNFERSKVSMTEEQRMEGSDVLGLTLASNFPNVESIVRHPSEFSRSLIELLAADILPTRPVLATIDNLLVLPTTYLITTEHIFEEARKAVIQFLERGVVTYFYGNSSKDFAEWQNGSVDYYLCYLMLSKLADDEIGVGDARCALIQNGDIELSSLVEKVYLESVGLWKATLWTIHNWLDSKGLIFSASIVAKEEHSELASAQLALRRLGRIRDSWKQDMPNVIEAYLDRVLAVPGC